MSRASKTGSTTYRLGLGQRWDMDQGPFSRSTGGLDLTRMGSLQPVTFHIREILRSGLPINRPLKKFKKIRANTGPVLLRQGGPGTPQYISSELFPEHTKHSLRINGISYTKTHSLINTCYINKCTLCMLFVSSSFLNA